MDLVAIHAAVKPDNVALVALPLDAGDPRTLTWAEYNAAKNRVANALVGLGVGREDKVIGYLHNGIERFLLAAADDTLGVTTVPVSYRLTAPEVAYIVNDAEARFVVFGEELADVVETVAPRCPGVAAWISTGESTGGGVLGLPALTAAAPADAPPELAQGGGVMMYTSGTTGNPKGAYREPGSTSAELRAKWFADMLAEFDIRGGDDVHLVAGPLYHGAPFSFSMIATGVGSTIVIMPKFAAETAAAAIRDYGVGYTVMAPVLVKRLLALGDRLADFDLSSLHTIVTTGAPCPQAVKEDVARRLGDVLYEFYGSTELAVNTVLKPADQLRKPGSCGRPFPGVELVVLRDDGAEAAPGEAGELFIRRHPLAFTGYYRRPGAVRTGPEGEALVSVGDVAYVDDDGYYYICDRKTDMIISGGVNVYPAEVEDALHHHPAIADAAVFGIPDDEFGESVHAVVELKPHAALSAAGLKEWLADRLADYKRPRSVEFVDELPRDQAGKLRKRELRAPFWEGREKAVN